VDAESRGRCGVVLILLMAVRIVVVAMLLALRDGVDGRAPHDGAPVREDRQALAPWASPAQTRHTTRRESTLQFRQPRVLPAASPTGRAEKAMVEAGG
jgi:hypothetical protein